MALMQRSSEPQADLGPYTWRDFVDLDEDDPRELLDGRLVEIEVPTWTHERIVAALILDLGTWALSRKAGQVLGSSYKLRIDAGGGPCRTSSSIAGATLPWDRRPDWKRDTPIW